MHRNNSVWIHPIGKEAMSASRRTTGRGTRRATTPRRRLRPQRRSPPAEGTEGAAGGDGVAAVVGDGSEAGGWEGGKTAGAANAAETSPPLERRFRPKRPRQQTSRRSVNSLPMNRTSEDVTANSGGDFLQPPEKCARRKKPKHKKAKRSQQGKAVPAPSPTTSVAKYPIVAPQQYRIIDPEQYHSKFCLPRRRRLDAARKMRLFMMNNYSAMSNMLAGGGGGGGQMTGTTTGTSMGGDGKGERSQGNTCGRQRSRGDSTDASSFNTQNGIVSTNKTKEEMMNQMMTRTNGGGVRVVRPAPDSNLDPAPGSSRSNRSFTRVADGAGGRRGGAGVADGVARAEMANATNRTCVRPAPNPNFDPAPGSDNLDGSARRGGVGVAGEVARAEMANATSQMNQADSGGRRSNHPAPNSNRPATSNASNTNQAEMANTAYRPTSNANNNLNQQEMMMMMMKRMQEEMMNRMNGGGGDPASNSGSRRPGASNSHNPAPGAGNLNQEEMMTMMNQIREEMMSGTNGGGGNPAPNPNLNHIQEEMMSGTNGGGGDPPPNPNFGRRPVPAPNPDAAQGSDGSDRGRTGGGPGSGGRRRGSPNDGLFPPVPFPGAGGGDPLRRGGAAGQRPTDERRRPRGRTPAGAHPPGTVIAGGPPRDGGWGGFGDDLSVGGASLGGASLGGASLGGPLGGAFLGGPLGGAFLSGASLGVIPDGSLRRSSPPAGMGNEGFFDRMNHRNNPHLSEKMAMLNMLNGGMAGGTGGGGMAGGMGGGGMGMGGPTGGMLKSTATSTRPTLGDADHGGGGAINSNAANSTGKLAQYSMDQSSSLGGGGGPVGESMGAMPFAPKSPMPKKSFLQRERIMDAEMRNHMREALAGFKKHHRRAGPRSGGGGGPGFGVGAGGGNDAPNGPSDPSFHRNPTAMAASHQTLMENKDRSMMMSRSNVVGQADTIGENTKRMNLPPLVGPEQDMADSITANINTVKNSLMDPGDANSFTADALFSKNMKIAATADALFLKETKSGGAKKGTSLKLPKKLSKAKSAKSGGNKQASKKFNRKDNKDAEESSGGSKKSKSLDEKKDKNPLDQKALTASILEAAKATLPNKPKRPFSAYNLFFQMEREFIMQEISDGRKPLDDPMIKDAMSRADASKAEAGDGEKAESGTASIIKDGGNKKPTARNPPVPPISKEHQSRYFSDPNVPPRYAHLRLDKHWYSVGHKQKRKHRKTKGSCGFIELTKMVSARWKVIDESDPHVKRYCQNLADSELETYKKDAAEYKALMKQAEAKAKAKAMEVAKEKEMAGEETGIEEVTKAGKTKQPLSSLPPSLEKTEEGDTSMGRKKRPKKEKAQAAAQAAAQEDRSSTPTEEQLNPQNTDFGGGDDMGRLTDCARMSGPFLGALDTPNRDNFFLAGLCGVAGDGRMPPLAGSGGGVSGLPAPPFSSDGRSTNEARMAESRVEEFQVAAVKEAQLAEARVAASGARTTDGNARASEAESVRMAEARADARSAAPTGDIQKRLEALAEAEARHRVQMEIHRGMMSNRASMLDNNSNQQRQDQHGFGMSRDAGASGMPRMPQDASIASGPSIGGFSPYSHKPAFMGQGNFAPGSSAGVGGLSSPLQRQFMERFRAGMPGGGTMPQSMPSYPPPPTPGESSNEDQHFDMEVERFLSCLGREIKDKHRKNRKGQGGAAVPAPSGPAGRVATGGFGGKFGAEGMGMGAGVGMRGAAPGLPNQMMMGMPMGMRAEMMAGVMRNSSGVNSNHSSAYQPSSKMMAEMTMARNSGGDGSAPNKPPFDGNDFQQRQQGVVVGGSDQDVVRDGVGKDDDNPSLSEYGWRRDGLN